MPKQYYEKNELIEEIKKYGSDITEQDIVRVLYDVKPIKAYSEQEVMDILNDLQTELMMMNNPYALDCTSIIQEKIDALRGETE